MHCSMHRAMCIKIDAKFSLLLSFAVLLDKLLFLLICHVSNSHLELCGNCLLDTFNKSSIALTLQKPLSFVYISCSQAFTILH